YSISLRDLKRAVASDAAPRRNPQLMALVLNKGCNAADVRFGSRPKGPSEQPYIGVVGMPHHSLCDVGTLRQEEVRAAFRLTYDCSEGQKHQVVDQRRP
ncbi:MAG: hypothetical protein O6945_01125, partial [Gammaproteobacteria bacterium]|nr:hypothetical protein [Gammaproteobacteria bacterium]